MDISCTYGMYIVCVYGEGGGHLPHHVYPHKEGDGPPPMERRICISCSLEKMVEINHENML